MNLPISPETMQTIINGEDSERSTGGFEVYIDQYGQLGWIFAVDSGRVEDGIFT